MADAENAKKISFFHGSETKLNDSITAGTIGTNSVVISTEDNMIYVDDSKVPHTLGNAKSKEAHTVQLGVDGSVGGIKTGDVIEAGTDLDALIKKIIMKRVPATYIAPKISLAVSKGAQPGNYEVGTTLTATMTANFTKQDAGALTAIKISDGTVDVLEGTTSPLILSDHSITVGEGTTSFKAIASYAEGAIKQDNLGDDSPAGHITAGSITSNVLSYIGKRNAFYGTGVGSVPELNSAIIRGLTGKSLNPTAGTKLTIKVAQGQQYIVFAYPAALRDVSQVKYEETNDIGMASSFTKQTMSVEGANGATAANYKVYSYAMAAPAAAPMTFTVTI